MTVPSPPETRATAQPSALTLEEYAAAKALPVEELKSWGLSTQDGKVRIPYHLPDGRESQAVRYRLSMEGERRFSWRKGSKPTLYGLERIDSAVAAGTMMVVEGESDWHTLWHHRYSALGIPGANTFPDKWLTRFDGFTTVYVVVEPDSGGEALLKCITKQPVQFRERVRLVHMTEHKDASALHLAGPDDFTDRFNDALTDAEPWADHERRQREAESTKALQGCEHLATAPDILRELDRSLERSGLVGERDTAFLLYLAFTSRVLEQPVSICVKGLSSAGKSFTLKQVAQHFPENAYVAGTGLSEHNLQYSDDDLQHKMLVVYEWRGIKDAGQYALESMLSEGHIVYRTVEKGEDGRLGESVRTRPGPTGFLTTTTRTRIPGDMENRLFAITSDDTDGQTRQIFREQGKHAEQAIERPTRPDADWAPWHALQGFIGNSPTAVSVPYAGILAELASPTSVRLRRDFPRMLALVKTHALLHQRTRERDDNGAIVATLTDYARVRKLTHDLMAEGASLSVSAETRATVDAVRALCQAGDSPGTEVTNQQVAAFLGLDKTTVSRRVKRAIDGGYLTNVEPNFRKPKKLVLGETLPETKELLPTAERVEWEMAKENGQHSTELPPNVIGCTGNRADRRCGWTLPTLTRRSRCETDGSCPFRFFGACGRSRLGAGLSSSLTTGSTLNRTAR